MSGKPFRIIAVDGGAASGKSSTSRGVAARLHYLHVDTGSHYRAVTFAGLEAGISLEAESELANFLASLKFETEIDGREALLRLNDSVPNNDQLRSAAVNGAVSDYAAVSAVRETVKSYQRDQAQVAREAGFNGVIVDGRDIGTVIFPQADLKIFLTADEATRVARREGEGQADAIAARDKIDAKRKTAPLKAAEDAVVIDNSALTLEEVIDRIIVLVAQD
jgi:cytidylate kinase